MTILNKISRLVSFYVRYQADRSLKKKGNGPVHIVFSTLDHYEPGTGKVDLGAEVGRVDTLLDVYPRLVEPHADADGIHPKRTWFFPPHYHRHNALKKLVGLCEGGFGEIELHLHHGKTRPDTQDNFVRTIRKCIEEYSLFGIFGQERGERKFAFIHGDWALNNSRGGKFCGIDNEIRLLIQEGCYADFTFPSMNEANPAKVNSIYYADGAEARAGCHGKGRHVSRGTPHPEEHLMMVQGPVYPYNTGRGVLGLRMLGDAIDGSVPATPAKIKAWVDSNIHVRGAENVVFIKTHTHGATDAEAVLGDEMDFIFTQLETRYNDGREYILHYATAREVYNIIRALQDGHPADGVHSYRDYVIAKPEYRSDVDVSSASKELMDLVHYSYE
jgi:hypothetical protein